MTNRSTALIVLLALAFGFLIGQVGIAIAHGGDGSLIHACVNDSSGVLKIVAGDDACQDGWHNVDWSVTGPEGPKGDQGDPGDPGPQGLPGPAGEGVKTISGIVNANGSANSVTSNGFTSTRLEAGIYRISFPAGTWESFPVMTVTPFGVLGAYGHPVVASVIGYGDGSADFVIHMVSSSQTLFDNGFMFIAAASLP